MRTVTKYQSKDGKIFDTEKECIIHETNASEEAIAIADTLRAYQIFIDYSDGYEATIKAAKSLLGYFDIKPKN